MLNSVAAAAVALTVGISIKKYKRGLKVLKEFKEDLIKFLLTMGLIFMMIMLIIQQKLKFVLNGVKSI